MEGTIKSLIPNIQYDLIGDKQYKDLSDDEKKQLQIDIDNQIKIISDKVNSITSNIQYQSWVYDILKNKNKDINEDFEVIKDLITDFEKLSKRPDVEPTEKNIQNYKTFQDLQKFILDFQNTHRQNKNIYRDVFKQVYKNSSYTMYLINRNQYKDCKLFFGGIDLEHYFNTGWCVSKNEWHFNSYLNKSPDDNNGYIIWINNSNNKPFALLHVGSMQFKDTSDKSIEDKSPDVLDGIFHFIDFEKYNKKDFMYYYKLYLQKTKYSDLTVLEIAFKLDNIKYDKKTNTVDLQNKPFKFKNEYLNEEGTFDFKMINWPTDCSNMFNSCNNTFNGCNKLRCLPEDFTIPNGVTDCGWMFYNCELLTHLPDNFTIPNSVTNCSKMFHNCTNLKSLLDTFKIPNSVTNCEYMFEGCTSLTHLPENFTIPNSVTDCGGMFRWCSNFTGKIPEVWNNTPSPPNIYENYAAECFNASNYDSIPQDWK